MFGFGDDQNPYTESVDLLEGLLILKVNFWINLTRNLNFFMLRSGYRVHNGNHP